MYSTVEVLAKDIEVANLFCSPVHNFPESKKLYISTLRGASMQNPNPLRFPAVR